MSKKVYTTAEEEERKRNAAVAAPTDTEVEPLKEAAEAAVKETAETTPAPSVTDKIKAAAGPATTLSQPVVKKPAAAPAASNLTNEQRLANAAAAALPEVEVKDEEIIADDENPALLDTSTEGVSTQKRIPGDLEQQYINQKNVNNAYDDLLKAVQKSNEKTEAELRSMEEGDRRAARWASVGEAVAAFGNSIAVAGGASHQQYKPVSADWMRQADATRKERMARVSSMEQNFAQQKARIAEMKQKGDAALYNARLELQDRKLKNRRAELEAKREDAMAKYYDAKTAAEAVKAKGEADLYDAKIQEINSRINRNNASAGAQTTKANAAASEAENRNKNRDSRTESQIALDEERKKTEGAKQKAYEASANYRNFRANNTTPQGTGVLSPEEIQRRGEEGKEEEKKKKNSNDPYNLIFG